MLPNMLNFLIGSGILTLKMWDQWIDNIFDSYQELSS